MEKIKQLILKMDVLSSAADRLHNKKISQKIKRLSKSLKKNMSNVYKATLKLKAKKIAREMFKKIIIDAMLGAKQIAKAVLTMLSIKAITTGGVESNEKELRVMDRISRTLLGCARVYIGILSDKSAMLMSYFA